MCDSSRRIPLRSRYHAIGEAGPGVQGVLLIQLPGSRFQPSCNRPCWRCCSMSSHQPSTLRVLYHTSPQMPLWSARSSAAYVEPDALVRCLLSVLARLTSPPATVLPLPPSPAHRATNDILSSSFGNDSSALCSCFGLQHAWRTFAQRGRIGHGADTAPNATMESGVVWDLRRGDWSCRDQ